MKFFTIAMLLFSLSFFRSCSDDETIECATLETDERANQEEFLGTWYEIASFPQFFNRGCECTTAEYSLNNDGTVKVFNSCKLYGFLPNRITGFAKPTNAEDFSKLEVKFPVSPTAGDYWIMEFAGDDYMLVGNPARDNLYILSRTPQMDQDQYDYLVTIAEQQCFDTSKLVITPQKCN